MKREKREYKVRISNEVKIKIKMFFNFIRRKITVRNNIDPVVDNDNDKLISDDKDIASILNLTFS